ncbi:hypothetical protein MKX03_008189 [Papaver bracteatum]|nr:hypothetical protein MKX03_008189 [Papaver bracteatum]
MDAEVCNIIECKDVGISDVVSDKDQSETIEPKLGMEFDTVDELYECYRIFGMKKGFGIVKRTSRKDNGILSHVCYYCVRGGKHKVASNSLNAGPTSKIDCKAHISARLYPDEKWRIVVLVADHNHELCPSSTRHLRCNKKIDTASKHKLIVNQKVGIRTNKSFHSLAVGAGGYDKLTFGEKEARNMLLREKLIEQGE